MFRIGQLTEPTVLVQTETQRQLLACGFGLIVYAVFDLVFFPAFYKNGYKAGKAFILASIPMVVLMIAVEAVAHIPELSWLDSYQPKYLLMQLPILVVGIICYTAFLSLAYRISVKYFDKVDL